MKKSSKRTVKGQHRGTHASKAPDVRDRRSRERDPLFSYPLTVPSETAYRELELGPDASDEEIAAGEGEDLAR